MQKRKEWIDVARGIGIILVILGHMNVCRNLWYSFHMPLFFFLSGYLYKQRSGKEILGYVVKRLCVPYCIWGILLSIGMGIVTKMKIIPAKSEYADIKEQLLHVLWGGDWNHAINAAPALWFLVALAEVVVLYWLIDRMYLSWKLKTLIVLIITIIGTGLLISGIILPVNLNAMLNVIIFYHAGVVINTNKVINDDLMIKKYKIFLVAGSLLGILILSSALNGDVDVHIAKLGNSVIMYYLNSFLGIALTLMLAITATRVQLLKLVFGNIGRHTMGIMCVHALLLYALRYIISFECRIVKEIVILVLTLIISYVVAWVSGQLQEKMALFFKNRFKRAQRIYKEEHNC